MSGLGMVTGFNLVLLDVGIIVALTALFAWIVNLILRGVMRASNPQVAVAMRRLGVAVVVAVGAVLAVQELGVSPSILLLVIGLVAVAAIVAIRVPLENAGARFFSGIYSPFKVGDTIRVAGQAGRVIEINAMTTILLSEDDRMVALPNSTFLGQPVENLSPQAWKELVVPVTLTGSTDLAAFESRMLKSLSKLRLRLDPRFPPVFTVKSRSVQGADLVLTVMVRRPEDREPVLAEVNLRVSEEMGHARQSASKPSGPSEPPSGS